MRKRAVCKIEGCERPRVQGALMCSVHLGEKRQCEGRVREVDPETGAVLSERQCKRSAKPGLTVCLHHGGGAAKLREVSDRTSALTAMERFVQPYDGPLDPVSAFENEFRRTYGRILWLEEQIAALEDEQALIWGLAKEEHVNAGEFPGTNTTYEARVNGFEEMLRWERKHFLELEKVWIRANLDEKRLNIMRDHITYTYTKVIETARALGHDPNDPLVRDKLMRLFGGGNEAVPALNP